MNLQDKRRILASSSALLAMPFFFICGFKHFCMCGHLAHPSYPWYHYANDIAWVSLLAVAFVFAFRSNLQIPELFVGLIIFMTVLNVIGMILLTLVLGGCLIMLCSQGLNNMKEGASTKETADTNESESGGAA